MSLAHDCLGNPVSSADAPTLAAIDTFIGGFLSYETRAVDILKAAADCDDALVNVYAGALFMLMESPKGPQRATFSPGRRTGSPRCPGPARASESDTRGPRRSCRGRSAGHS